MFNVSAVFAGIPWHAWAQPAFAANATTAKPGGTLEAARSHTCVKRHGARMALPPAAGVQHHA